MNFLMHGGVVTGIFNNLNGYTRPSKISRYKENKTYGLSDYDKWYYQHVVFTLNRSMRGCQNIV